MNHSFSDTYSSIKSPVHSFDPVVKLPAAILLILAIVSHPFQQLQAFIFYLILVSIILIISRVPLFYIFKKMFVVMPFVLLAAVFFPLTVGFSGSGSFFSMDNPAVVKGISIFIKAMLSVIVLLILISTQKFHSLLGAMRRLKMPSVVCVTSALMYRYVFILADESMKTSLARQSRTPGRLRKNKMKVIGNQMAVVFLRSWNRSKIIYNAMLSRGFTGEFPSAERPSIAKTHIVIFCIFVLLLVYLRFMPLVHQYVFTFIESAF
jgi:cobalt/nickel transport system permease protein